MVPDKHKNIDVPKFIVMNDNFVIMIHVEHKSIKEVKLKNWYPLQLCINRVSYILEKYSNKCSALELSF